MKLLLIGPPGAGKTVIANKITEKLGIPFIKTGELLRAVGNESPFYEIINDSMTTGRLAPNDIVGQIVKNETQKYPNGYVLDGWLRQISDAEVYLPELDWVIFLDCPKEICIERVLNRVVCKIHGSVYSFSEEVCSLCKGKLEKRPDDTLETFESRWGIYYEKTLPVVDFFKNKNILLTIDASKSVVEVVNEVLEKIRK